MATIGEFQIQEYFLTGEIPKGISQKKLFEDCLDTLAIFTVYNMPVEIKNVIANAAVILGITDIEKENQSEKDISEGFMHYGYRSGLL